MTDITTSASNICLLHISKYIDVRKNNKKFCFIDPGVTTKYFKTCGEFQHIEKLHWLASGNLQPNEFVGIDYPSDMFPSKETEFIQKSIENNYKYKDNLQYICGVQYKWMDYDDFEFRMKELEPIYMYKKRIVGLGNLCRLLLGIRKKDHPEYIYISKK